jgi:biopolymer transport protein TolQ
MYIIKYFLEATAIVKVDIILLIVLSIVIWAIFFEKNSKLNMILNYADSFEKSFWSGINLEEFYNANKSNLSHPLGIVFGGAMEEWTLTNQQSQGLSEFAKLSLRDRIYESIEYSKIKIDQTLSKNQSLLLTISSLAPFLGLFGTICGIINTFYQIGLTGNANIATIAPGVAEALITTAFSIILAVCSGIMYNFFNAKIAKINYKIDCFSIDIINILSREVNTILSSSDSSNFTQNVQQPIKQQPQQPVQQAQKVDTATQTKQKTQQTIDEMMDEL